MRLTFLGHAGVFIETGAGTILCDPWFNPAFFASWFPFPDNGDLDVDAISSPDFLYVSHPHDDHLDARFLHEHVDKSAAVILPDFPTDDHRRALAALGFHEFVRARNGEPLDLGGARVLVQALTAPGDGAIGDSGLAVADESATVFNQNDSKPSDLDALEAFGPYDGHLVQFSGAIWYPMVYRFPADERRVLGRRKRANEMARAARFVDAIGAHHFFPFAGPPCFLDDELFGLNDFGEDDANIFPDETVFLDFMRARGRHHGHLVVPGTVVELADGACAVRHPLPAEAVERPFRDKAQYLRDYQARRRDAIAAEKATWPSTGADLVAELTEWWEPLLRIADHVAAGVDGRILLRSGDEAVVVDFLARRVGRWQGEQCRYRFTIPRPLFEACVARRAVDWVNGLFLSCRFEAERDGPYNEFVYAFFRALSRDRMEYVERYYSRLAAPVELWRCDGYEIQRRCPHLGADLTKFGSVDDGILTCALHGWRFDLETGRCLTSNDRRLVSRRVECAEVAPDPAPRR